MFKSFLCKSTFFTNTTPLLGFCVYKGLTDLQQRRTNANGTKTDDPLFLLSELSSKNPPNRFSCFQNFL